MLKMIKSLSGLVCSLFRRLFYRSTVGLAVLMFCVLFPSLSSALTIDEIRASVGGSLIYYYDSSWSLKTFNFYGDLNSVISGFKIHDIAVSCSSSRLLEPDIDDLPYLGTNSYSSSNNTRPVFNSSNTRYYRLTSFVELPPIYKFAQSLYGAGYRGSGFTQFESINANSARFNFNYSLAVADIASSTNTVFRQILLSHLSSIQSTVLNIDSSLGVLRSSVDVGNDFLSSIYLSSSNSVEVLSGIHTNVVVLSSVPSLLLDSVDSLSLLHDDFTLSNIDVALGDDTSAWVDFLDWSVEQGYLNAGTAINYADSLRATDPVRGSKAASNVLRRAIVKNQIKNTVVECVQLRGRYQSIISPDIRNGLQNQGRYFNKAFRDDIVDMYSSRTSQLNDWRDQVRQQLQDWKTDLKSDLQAWKTSDETRYLNIKNSIDDNFSYSSRGLTNKLPFTSFVTNYVTVVLTNTIQRSSADIQSNATYNADRQIDQSQSIWDEFKREAIDDSGSGLNVRIKFPLWESDLYHVNVRDDAVLEAIQNLHAMPSELTSIKDNVQWFKDGGPLNVNLPTNLVEILDSIFDAITNRPSYMLLDDYASYISNGVYAASIEQLSIDFPNVYTNLQKYGLVSSGDGNFWTLFGANLIYQSGLIGSLLEDMATIRKFADDHIEGGFSGGISSIVRKFPSASHLEDQINSSTGQVVQINLATTNLVFNFESVTNVAPSVFKPFADSFDSPPSGDIVFFKTANDKYVSIPVHDQASVWSLIRLGIGFALIGVQFLLFPKFVLVVVVLFSRLSSRFVKFVPSDR